MGKRGPAPKPTALRVLSGETKPSRVNRREPKPEIVALVAPDDLTDEAKSVWKETLLSMDNTGVITLADSEALRMYSEAVVRYREAQRMLARSSPLIRGRTGDLVKNPLHQVVRDNAMMVKGLARELGLTPAARVGLTTSDGAGGTNWKRAQSLADLMRQPAVEVDE